MNIKVFLDALRQVVLKPNAAKPGGVSQTITFNPSQEVKPSPTYRGHTEDLFDTRTGESSLTLLPKLFKQDSDLSASVSSYLTVANTDLNFLVRNSSGEIDPTGHETLMQIIDALTVTSDYSQGFTIKQNINQISENFRYMLLLRGVCMAELVLDKLRLPDQVRIIDTANVEFTEKVNGLYKPQQKAQGGQVISLDVPTVFISYYHRNPNEIYGESSFASAINTIAARQQVINSLYRIMNVTGMPRIKLQVLEEVLLKSAPEFESVSDRNNYVLNVLNSIATQFSNLRPEDAFVTTDSVQADILGGGRVGAELRIDEVIKTLNDQNQAAMKTMSTVIGRGDSGVNTGSVEARIFAMNADELNMPVAALWSNLMTFAMRLMGYDGKVECRFSKAELRPDLELEPQKVLKQSRLQKDLSLGLITDEEYHLQMYNRLPPKGVPILAGTRFLDAGKMDSVNNADNVSPNSDPLGRSVAPSGDGAKAAKSNSVKNETDSFLPGQVAYNANTGASITYTGKRWVDSDIFDLIGLELDGSEERHTTGISTH